jgi:hypothetical protein
VFNSRDQVRSDGLSEFCVTVMAANAAGVGIPHTAGVGCRAVASSTAPTPGSMSLPSIQVDKCQRFAMATSESRAGTTKSRQYGRSRCTCGFH